MNDVKDWREQISLTFQRLSPKSGDVVVVNFPPDIIHERMVEIYEPLNDELSDGITVLCMRSGMTVEMLSEEAMNTIGWYKMGTIQ